MKNCRIVKSQCNVQSRLRKALLPKRSWGVRQKPMRVHRGERKFRGHEPNVAVWAIWPCGGSLPNPPQSLQNPSQNVNIGSCPLPERARCVKGGLRGFCRLCVPACSSNAQTFHALRVSGMLSWYVGLHGSFRCRLRSTFIDLLQCYDFICEVCSVVLFCMRPCLNPSLRGRPRTVGRVRARARSARHR